MCYGSGFLPPITKKSKLSEIMKFIKMFPKILEKLKPS